MIFGRKNDVPPMSGAIRIATVHDPVSSAILRDLLEQAGIPSIGQPALSLDPLPALANSNMLGEDIYVQAEQEQDARAIAEAFMSGAYAKQEQPFAPEEEESNPCNT